MILVTGATGMTGQFVVQELGRRNVPVRALVREASVEKAAQLGAEIAIGDLADFASLHRAMEDVTGVAHVACTFTDVAVDVAAMGVLLNNWRDGPFIFVSSLDVYGLTENNPVTEEHPLSETYGDYGRGKVICERMLYAKAQAEGRTDFAMLRAPHIIGPHPKGRRFVNQVTSGEPIQLPGADEVEWSQFRDAWIDVRDLARVVAETLETPPGGPLNVLSDHFVWHDLYEDLIRLTGSSSQIIHTALSEMDDEQRESQKTLIQRWFFDNSKLKQILEFEPTYTLGQTLADTVHDD
ncbi:NAD(P)-dependent oxidoreductase [Chloroflexi bacterium TSY]|nr:NAD(P)-dependent oxidoreductase [Chloroflexi bacterium TSY]